MEPYRAKTLPFAGTRYADIAPQARRLFKSIQRQTKRRPYVRSIYFHKDKIFFTYLWAHLTQRSPRQRAKRPKYLPCAPELIRKSRQTPTTKENVDRPNEVLHRFGGLAQNNIIFFVQIKEDKRTNRKELISVFPKT